MRSVDSRKMTSLVKMAKDDPLMGRHGLRNAEHGGIRRASDAPHPNI
jgi:hypothetical protein